MKSFILIMQRVLTLTVCQTVSADMKTSLRTEKNTMMTALLRSSRKLSHKSIFRIFRDF